MNITSPFYNYLQHLSLIPQKVMNLSRGSENISNKWRSMAGCLTQGNTFIYKKFISLLTSYVQTESAKVKSCKNIIYMKTWGGGEFFRVDFVRSFCITAIRGMKNVKFIRGANSLH